MKKLAIFDIDGTIVRGQSQKLFLKYLLSTGQISRSFYLRLMMWFILYKLGLVKDPKKTMEYAFSFLKGREVGEIAAMAQDFFEKGLKSCIYSDASDIISKHQDEGCEVILVSNAAEPIVKTLASYLKASQYICTTLEIIDGHYTGKITDIMYGERKAEAVKSFIEANGFDPSDSWAYGDHSSDEYVLSLVGHPVAVNPTPSLLKIANGRHWQIVNFK